MHKKFLVAGIAATVFIFVFEFLVHGVALMGMYDATASLWRPLEEMEAMWWFSLLIQAAIGFAMACYMSKRGIAGRKAGFEFGSMIGVLFAIMALSQYGYLPLAMTLPIIWAVASWVKMAAVGAIIGHFYREDSGATA